MSYEDGKSITNIDYIKNNKISLNEIAKILTDTFNKQIFQLGFIHSDPHPGNLFVRKENVNGKLITRLVLLDHGLYRDLDDNFRINYCSLWRGLITQNKEILRESCNNLNIKEVELFISILTSNTYEELMNTKNKYSSHKQLGLRSRYFIIKSPKSRQSECKNTRQFITRISLTFSVMLEEKCYYC